MKDNSNIVNPFPIQMISPRLCIVGNPEMFHVGSHFFRAAQKLNLTTSLVDVREADKGPQFLRKVFWHFLGHRPFALSGFSRKVNNTCQNGSFNLVLTVGLAPVQVSTLKKIRKANIVTANFLTDDPFNAAHKAPWFLKALPYYNFIFSPRRANIPDLEKLGCPKVNYLPFAYDPDLHKPLDGGSEDEKSVDVLFAGGADPDRLPYARTLIKEGFKIALYGGYWDRYPDLKPFWKGQADLKTLCRVTPSAKIVLCLVRKANRDGHSMRTFEAPAMGGCLLLEDTLEHREMFGFEGECGLYFQNPKEMTVKVKSLLVDREERQRLSKAAFFRIVNEHNTYKDRLIKILELTVGNK